MFGTLNIFDWQLGHVTLATTAPVDLTAGAGAQIIKLRASSANTAPVWLGLNAAGGTAIPASYRLDAGQEFEIGPLENVSGVYVQTDTTGQIVSYFTGWK